MASSPEIVFIVDGFDSAGNIVTVADRLKSISDNWQPNLFEQNKAYYRAFCTDRVQFVAYKDIGSFDPNKKYLYFVPLNDWHWNIQQFFMLVSRDMQRRFAENGVGFYFCQDLEMYPNVGLEFFVHYVGIVNLFRAVHSYPNVPIYFSLMSDLIPPHKEYLQAYGEFKNIKYVTSPLLFLFAREELIAKNGSIDVGRILDAYLTGRKEKQFMALSRDPKYHRLTMMHALRAYDLLDDGYVSNLITRPYSSDPLKARKTPFSAAVAADMDVSLMPRMTLDDVGGAAPYIRADGVGGNFPHRFMEASCYDLVQETATRYEASGMLDFSVVTEKVLKSLMLGRPFMINGGPLCLSLLKRWGFKTYEHLFDESYDALADFTERQDVIIKNVLRYKRRRDVLMDKIRADKETLIHNVNNVMSFDFEGILVNEILSGA
jgi:hypothetical protein